MSSTSGMKRCRNDGGKRARGSSLVISSRFEAAASYTASKGRKKGKKGAKVDAGQREDEEKRAKVR